MPDIIVKDKILGYEAQPENFDRSRLSVVCLHGSGGDREDWRNQLNSLSDHANVIAVELPGHGTSQPPPESSVASYAEWVAGFIDALQLERVFLVGCSLGSAIVQQLALNKNPWLVGIGLVGAGARLRVHPSFLEGVMQDKDKATGLLAEFALAQGCRQELKEALEQKFRECRPELIHADLSACNEFDVIGEVNQISLPTIIIVGKEDRLTPVKYSEFLHNAISDSRMEVIEGAGHLVMMEQPEAFNRALASFLTELP